MSNKRLTKKDIRALIKEEIANYTGVVSTKVDNEITAGQAGWIVREFAEANNGVAWHNLSKRPSIEDMKKIQECREDGYNKIYVVEVGKSASRTRLAHCYYICVENEIKEFPWVWPTYEMA